MFFYLGPKLDKSPIPPNISLPDDSKFLGGLLLFLWSISSLCCDACILVLLSLRSSLCFSLDLLPSTSKPLIACYIETLMPLILF